MKKILFDLHVCQPIGHIKSHGGGVYGYIVFKSLCLKEPQKIVAYVDKTRYIDPKIKSLIEDLHVLTVDASVCSIKQAIKDDICLLYSPLYTNEYKELLDGCIPIFITIHGLRKLEMNRDKFEYMYAGNIQGWLKAMFKQTLLYNFLTKKYYMEYLKLLSSELVKVITVSNHSKNSICFYYPFVDIERVQVYYSPSTTEEGLDIQPYSKKKYYLIISADRWLKNAYRAMLAFDLLFEKRGDLEGKVIVLGLSKKNRLVNKMRHKERFTTFDYVDRPLLESLLRGAYSLVYPSLNEGFGYPPLEAMKYGVPVISSSFSAISEVCGDSVLYVNPYSCDEIAMRILELENKNMYQEYRERAFNRYEYILNKQKRDLEKLCMDLLAYTE